MSIRVVRLGTDREKGEGLRLGTVRRPPRGVKKERLAADKQTNSTIRRKLTALLYPAILMRMSHLPLFCSPRFLLRFGLVNCLALNSRVQNHLRPAPLTGIEMLVTVRRVIQGKFVGNNP